jgi:hypothetical protein
VGAGEGGEQGGVTSCEPAAKSTYELVLEILLHTLFFAFVHRDPDGLGWLPDM